MTKSEFVRDFITQWIANNKIASKRTMAKALHEQHPDKFPTFYNARDTIKNIMGSSSRPVKSTLKEEWVAFKERFESDLPLDIEDYEVPKGHTRAIIACDIHQPYLCDMSMDSMLNYAHRNGITSIILNGDFMDNKAVNPHGEYVKKDFAYEVEKGRELLGILAKQFTGLKVFKFGNHDIWFERKLKQQLSVISSLEDFQLPNILRIGEHGFKYVTDKSRVKFGKLDIFHGHEFGKMMGSPVSPAKTLYDRTKIMACCGHFHRTSEFQATDANGNITVCWSIGGLLNLKTSYLPYNQWNNGFADVEIVDDEGDFIFTNRKIVKGRIY